MDKLYLFFVSLFFSSLNKKINIFNKFDGVSKKKYSKRDQNVTMSVEKLKRK